MNKNMVILAMSTLPGNAKFTKNVKPERFKWREKDTEGQEYICQLEPTSKMIREREGSLDEVVILATKETRKKDLDDGTLSVVDFYIERMGLNSENTKVIGIEEDDFIPAISEAVEIIRQYWKDNDQKVNLWIDTQGSFRNINLVLNAVITLLEPDGIKPRGIYSLNYIRGRELQLIEDQTETYKIFHFVSGINEFTRSGRAEQLTDYYHHTGKAIPEVITIMKNIAEAIQMCDMSEFDQHLAQLREEAKKASGDSGKLFEIFRDQIKRDYGKLLDDDCTGLDIVEWFYKKGFYQQAITYIEAKLPQEWLIKNSEQETFNKGKAIISYDIDENILQTLKERLKKTFEKDENIIISQIGVECFKWSHICFKDKKTNQIRYSDLKNLRLGRKDKYRKSEDFQKIRVSVKKGDYYENLGNMKIIILRENQNRVIDLLLLYKLLKSERNNFNHMSEDNVRASREKLGETIRIFIKMGRRVYEDIC